MEAATSSSISTVLERSPDVKPQQPHNLCSRCAALDLNKILMERKNLKHPFKDTVIWNWEEPRSTPWFRDDCPLCQLIARFQRHHETYLVTYMNDLRNYPEFLYLLEREGYPNIALPLGLSACRLTTKNGEIFKRVEIISSDSFRRLETEHITWQLLSLQRVLSQIKAALSCAGLHKVELISARSRDGG